jgi:hypothetical protein
MPRPDHVARLYSVPLSEFTATRKQLADELRKKGRGDEARSLAQLRKPSAALWAVNRLAATEGKRLSALFDAVARLRQSQLRDPTTAAESLRAQRAALESLVSRGREVLAGAGLTASQQALRRLSDTLMGAAIDREHADALRRGELTEELPAPGFEAFSGVRLPAPPRLRLVRSPAASAASAADREAAAARAAETERRRALEADTLARQAAEHTRDVSELEAERSAARARMADLDRRLRTARRAARQATAAAKRARRPPTRPSGR